MLHVQFEAARIPQPVAKPSCSFGAPQVTLSSDAAHSSQSAATVDSRLGSHGEGSQPGAAHVTEQAQQSSAVGMVQESRQQEGAAEGQSFLFSNPTFESYLDSNSDDELAPVSGCTTPRSAIKQQASSYHPAIS